MPDFRDTTDFLMKEGVTLEEVADAFGVTANTVNRWRMEGHPMLPREGWEEVIEDLMYAHAEALKQRAAETFRRARAFSTAIKDRELSTGAGK